MLLDLWWTGLGSGEGGSGLLTGVEWAGGLGGSGGIGRDWILFLVTGAGSLSLVDGGALFSLDDDVLALFSLAGGGGGRALLSLPGGGAAL